MTLFVPIYIYSKCHIAFFYFLFYILGELLGRYCGTTIPAAVYTASNLAYIKFVTDESIYARGFRLHFAASADGKR